MEVLVFGLLLAGAVALFVVLANMSRRPPSAVDAFNQMAEEAMRTRSRLEWSLRIGVGFGFMGLLMTFDSLNDHGELLPPAGVVYPAIAVGGALCGAALWFWFLRHERRK